MSKSYISHNGVLYLWCDGTQDIFWRIIDLN